MTEKRSFLLLSLKEKKLRKIAETIGSETAQKIIDLIAERGSATETEIASALQIPLSTVHYNIKNLVESTLVSANEFHYSKRGKEVNHYSLSNRYIIIAPKEEEPGVRSKLKNLLLTFLIIIGTAYLLSIFKKSDTIMQSMLSQKTIADAQLRAEGLAGAGAHPLTPVTANVALWFVAGAAFAVVVYLLIEKIRNFYAERKEK